MARNVFLIALILATLAPALAIAQQLPSPSRTVYKCNLAGKVVYSDEPCKGAEKLVVEPTRGMDSSSGRKSIGTDVSRERNREALAEGLRPLTGMNAKELDAYGRRLQLAGAAQRECAALDTDIAQAEGKEAQTAGKARGEIQELLFVLRKRFRELRC